MAQRTYPAELDSLEDMLEFINEVMVQLGADRERLFKVRLAAEELLVNIIHYAYPDSHGELSIDCSKAEQGEPGVFIEIRDAGIPFNILEKQEPDITQPMEDREIGGLGIFLTRQVMDEISYEREDGQNIVRMVKRL